MAEDQPRRVTLEDYSSSTVPQFFTSIARPEVQAHNITYPHSLIQLIQGNLFHGLPNEDPYAYLATYIEICNIVKIAGVMEDTVRLSLFSFSLSGRPQSKQLLDASVGGKIKLKTPEEAIELIENMAASDRAILHDRTHIPTKRSLLELSSQDVLLAQNKLLSKQLENLTETLSKLPNQFHVNQPSHSTVLQVGGCSICGGAHESGCCIPIDDTTQEVNYMGNKPRPNFNASGYSGFQHAQNYNQQQRQ
ncbi:uncharacterized protein LOC114383843 [Glycine soja]|uniref:uncharacterized protein n=1 Tax=Glycine max TaxID=3847 RepID=UPI0003DE73DC|nr:uncharacterized protein LOC102663805 [Glycine max]XP_028199370.1 uncharacterized protein LOC114383843 [Glycine soja]|eukprot:XP_006596684.1 uncharacterized protein LOC102663805 [Glycine max]